MLLLRIGSAVALAVAVLGCAAPRPFGDGVSLNANLSAGARTIEDDVYDGGAVYGFEVATRDEENGWGYELGFTYGSDEAGGPRAPSGELNEYYVGLRHSWESPERRLRPYVGFGGSYTTVEHRLHDPRFEFDERGGAAYLHGGVMWSLGRLDLDRGLEVLLGIDGRGVLGDEFDSAGIAVVLGFGR